MDPNVLPSGQPAADPSNAAPESLAPPGQEQNAPLQTGAPAEPPQTPNELAQAQEQLNQERQRREQVEAQLANHQRQLADNAARQFQQAERDLHAWLPTADPDEAVKATTAFYQQREQQLLNMRQQEQSQMYQERVNAFAQHLIQTNGLQASDAPRLLSVAAVNPALMEDQAKAIVAERQGGTGEIQKLRHELEQLKRGQQAQGIQQSGAWKGGGANGNAAPANALDPRSDQYDEQAHYLRLIGAA